MEPVRIEELALLKCMKGLHILQSERGLIFFFFQVKGMNLITGKS